MIQKLIVLGFLKKDSASGYDIKKSIDKELGLFSEIENRSIYYPLKKMEKEGLIRKKELKIKGHLKKYIYSITPQGEKEFFKLFRQSLLSQKRPFIESDIALYFISFLRGEDILPLLRLRLRFLENVKKWLFNKEKELKSAPKNLDLLLKHHLKLAAAEKDFIGEMIDIVKSSFHKNRG